MIIEKEKLPQVDFASAEVITDKDAKKMLDFELKKAETLGNGYRTKVSIYFRTAEGEELRIHTTVWSVGEQFITVKGNRAIPKKAITRIEF